MTMRHDEPHVVTRDSYVREDTSSPALLIIGILLAIGLAIGAWFAFANGDNDGGDTINNPTFEVDPGTDSGTTGDSGTTSDSGTTGDTGTSGDTTTP